MSEQRRADLICWEPGDVLAFIYTLCYMVMVGAVMYFKIPTENVQIVNTLVTIMSTIQIGIGKYYYDRTRADSIAQRATAVRQSTADTAIQEIAKAAAPVAAAAVAAATGAIAPSAPAAEAGAGDSNTNQEKPR